MPPPPHRLPNSSRQFPPSSCVPSAARSCTVPFSLAWASLVIAVMYNFPFMFSYFLEFHSKLDTSGEMTTLLCRYLPRLQRRWTMSAKWMTMDGIGGGGGDFGFDDDVHVFVAVARLGHQLSTHLCCRLPSIPRCLSALLSWWSMNHGRRNSVLSRGAKYLVKMVHEIECFSNLAKLIWESA